MYVSKPLGWENRRVSIDISDYVSRHIIGLGEMRSGLERQPEKVAEFCGKLCEFLLKKNIMSEEEFFEMVGNPNSSWGDEPIEDTELYKLVKE